MSKNIIQEIGSIITGYNKVLLRFITNKSLNGTGFKAQAKLSISNFIHKVAQLGK